MWMISMEAFKAVYKENNCILYEIIDNTVNASYTVILYPSCLGLIAWVASIYCIAGLVYRQRYLDAII